MPRLGGAIPHKIEFFEAHSDTFSQAEPGYQKNYEHVILSLEKSLFCSKLERNLRRKVFQQKIENNNRQ